MKTKTHISQLGYLLVAAALLTFTPACSSDSGSDDDMLAEDVMGEEDMSGEEDVAGEEDAMELAETAIRVLHLSPDAPAVDLYVNGGQEAAITDLAFPDGTDFVTLDEGDYTFDIAPAMTSIDDSVKSVDVSLEGDKTYTAVAYGKLADGLMVMALEDDLSDAGENIRVRAIHAAADVGQVDIWNIPSEGDPSPLYENVDFGVAGDYLEIPAGAYTLGFDVDDDASPDVIFETPELAAGTIANIFAVNDSEGNVSLRVQFADSSLATIEPKAMEETKTADIRVLHLSPDAPAVDLYVNGGEEAAIADLAFPDGTGFVTLDEGDYTFEIAPAMTSIDDSVKSVDVSLMGDKFYTAVAHGKLADGLMVVALEEDLSDPGDNIRVRAIHAAADVGQVDIWNIPAEGEPSPLYENVDFGVAGDYLEIPAGAYTLGFDVDDDASPDVIFETPELAAGTVANIFAVNDSEGNVSLRVQFADSSLATIQPKTMEEPEVADLRVLHLSPDAPAVDIYVNGDAQAAIEGLAFTEGTGNVSLEEGDYTFDIAPAMTSIDDSVKSVDVSLAGNTHYTAVAYGKLADGLMVMALEDNLTHTGDSVRLRAIHAAPDVGQVDIWNIPTEGDASPLYENVDFGVAGDYLVVPPGAYTLGFDVNDDAIPDVIFQTPELPAGTIANVFAVNDTMGNVSLRVQFGDSTLATLSPAM